MFSRISGLKFYFSSPYFYFDPFHVLNSLLSHSCCYFLNPQFRGIPFLRSFPHVPISVQLYTAITEFFCKTVFVVNEAFKL